MVPNVYKAVLSYTYHNFALVHIVQKHMKWPGCVIVANEGHCQGHSLYCDWPSLGTIINSLLITHSRPNHVLQIFSATFVQKISDFRCSLDSVHGTLTCQIIVQQTYYFLGERTPTQPYQDLHVLLISNIFHSKPDFHLHK